MRDVHLVIDGEHVAFVVGVVSGKMGDESLDGWGGWESEVEISVAVEYEVESAAEVDVDGDVVVH